MVDDKQQMEQISPKMIDVKTMGKEVRVKNILQEVATTNRGPKPIAEQSPTSEMGTNKDLSKILSSKNVTSAGFQGGNTSKAGATGANMSPKGSTL